MNEINAKIPDTIFYSKQKESIVKNDFYFTIEINCHIRKEYPKLSYNPKIYIRGLEQLFSGTTSMGYFVQKFQASSNADKWHFEYGCFRETTEFCLVATYYPKEEHSIPENIFPVTFRSIQEKFHFTADFSKFSSINPIKINIHFDNFDFFTSDLKDRIDQTYTIQAKEIAYILDFYAKNADNVKVQAIHKGENALIGWDLSNVQRISASLCDENGKEVSTLPNDYSEVIDKDRKFTLNIEKDGHVETKSMTVYKTLWKKFAEVDSSNLPEGFKPDPKGKNKFFCRDNDYYIYIHPKLYMSKDLINWEEYAVYDNPPEKYNSYCCNYLDDYEEITIAYACDTRIILREYHFRAEENNKWTDPISITSQTNQQWILCQAVKRNGITMIFAANSFLFQIFTIYNNILKNHIVNSLPKEINIISIDSLFLSNNESIFAILCDNRHVYIYNYSLQTDKGNYVYVYDNKYKNDIFEFEKENQRNVFLLNTHLIYTVLDNYVFSLKESERFTDTHFSPLDSIANESNQKLMIIGEKDAYTFSAIILKEQNTCIWNYKF